VGRQAGGQPWAGPYRCIVVYGNLYDVKTTLNLDDELLRQAKRVALERGVTLTQVVREALEAAVLPKARGRPFQLDWRPVRGHRAPSVDLADRGALYDLMEDRS
jgi:hypothetical protein